MVNPELAKILQYVGELYIQDRLKVDAIQQLNIKIEKLEKEKKDGQDKE